MLAPSHRPACWVLTSPSSSEPRRSRQQLDPARNLDQTHTEFFQGTDVADGFDVLASRLVRFAKPLPPQSQDRAMKFFDSPSIGKSRIPLARSKPVEGEKATQRTAPRKRAASVGTGFPIRFGFPMW